MNDKIDTIDRKPDDIDEELKSKLQISSIRHNKTKHTTLSSIQQTYLKRKVLFNQIRHMCIQKDIYEYTHEMIELGIKLEDFNAAIYGSSNIYNTDSTHLNTLYYMSE